MIQPIVQHIASLNVTMVFCSKEKNVKKQQLRLEMDVICVRLRSDGAVQETFLQNVLRSAEMEF